jgi:hypothetical protein
MNFTLLTVPPACAGRLVVLPSLVNKKSLVANSTDEAILKISLVPLGPDIAESTVVSDMSSK